MCIHYTIYTVALRTDGSRPFLDQADTTRIRNPLVTPVYCRKKKRQPYMVVRGSRGAYILPSSHERDGGLLQVDSYQWGCWVSSHISGRNSDFDLLWDFFHVLML